MPTVLVTISYDGTNYSGWQVQPNGLTVQQVVEDALEQLLQERVQVRSSGRTDAGVHARAMAAAFTTARVLPLQAFVEGANRFLPADVAIQSARFVPEGFKPITMAHAKWYRYTIINSPVRAPLDRLYSWLVREPLDFAAMEAAADHFVGTHDFAAFRAANCVAKTTVRRIDSVQVIRHASTLVIDVIGGGFLKNMVRVMVGTLVDIGKGRFMPSDIDRMLREGDRRLAGSTAPACGLCLMQVTYPEEVISPPAGA
ncbi:MAG: tRNA pseudouridine(38-40) synthase TruA [Desulfuromonadaceae bacterium]|nr:tRNA pseudouridine(38-40) synthase TruA [Desulfuromonadaceae bacterium]MDD5104529.1 tRNA pseudouridine(38-40) synthase TruA [Desulfuromonadaceae bacterium]